MATSWRHHYVPIFYLKGFTDASSKLFIYDKKRGRPIRRSQSPRSFFFIKNRHTLLNLRGEYDDFIETSLYKSFDNITSNALNDLRSNPVNKFNDDLSFLSKIVILINGLIYRIPKYDSYHNRRIDDGDAEYLLPIHDGEGNDVSYFFYQTNKANEQYRFACRFYCSIRQSLPVPSEAKNWTIYSLPDDYRSKYYLLSGDSPILINDISLFKTTDDVIIAPLSQTHFVIRSRYSLNSNIDVLQLVHLLNMGIIINCIEYVCSPNQAFLNQYMAFSKGYTEEAIWRELKACFSNNEKAYKASRCQEKKRS